VKRREFVSVAALAVIGTPLVCSTKLAVNEHVEWQPDGVGSLARIGVLTPDDDPVPESEMWTMATHGLSIHAARVVWNHDAAAFAQPPRVTCQAATEALRLLKALRVALIQPPWFSEEVTAKGRDYFRSQGFDVVLCDRLTPARPFTEIAPSELYDWVRANVPRQAQAVFVAGNGLRAIGTIQPLEHILGKPVLTANQVCLWKALQLVGSTSVPTQYGRIFTLSR